jgi:hypothetical protein
LVWTVLRSQAKLVTVNPPTFLRSPLGYAA